MFHIGSVKVNLGLVEFLEVCHVIDENDTVVFTFIEIWEPLLESLSLLLKPLVPVLSVIIGPRTLVCFLAPGVPNPQQALTLYHMCIQDSVYVSLSKSSA